MDFGCNADGAGKMGRKAARKAKAVARKALVQSEREEVEEADFKVSVLQWGLVWDHFKALSVAVHWMKEMKEAYGQWRGLKVSHTSFLQLMQKCLHWVSLSCSLHCTIVRKHLLQVYWAKILPLPCTVAWLSDKLCIACVCLS